MKKFLKYFSLILAILTTAASVISCSDTDNVLKIGVFEIENDFSPFSVEESASAGAVKDMIYSRLISVENDSSVVWGEDKNCLASDVEVYISDSSFEPSDNGNFTAVKVTLKNGMKFSNSSSVTADDVIFSVYALTDNATGSLKYDNFPLVGLNDYITRKTGTEEITAEAKKAVLNGFTSDKFTEEELYAIRTKITTEGYSFTEGICNYVIDNYLTDSSAKAYIMDNVTADDVKKSAGLTVAFAMKLWNWGTFVYEYTEDPEGSFVGVKNSDGIYSYKTTLQNALENEMYVTYVKDETGKYAYDYSTQSYYEDTDGTAYIHYSKKLADNYTIISRTKLSGFRDSEGTLYTINGNNDPSIENFFALMARAYTENGITNYSELEQAEGTDDNDGFFQRALSLFAAEMSDGESPSSIKGIKKEIIENGGTKFEEVTFLFNDIIGDAAELCTFRIASKDEYMNGYDSSGEINEIGFPINNSDFAEHVKEKSKSPIGSGPYKVISSNKNEISLSANQLFSSMGTELFRPYTEYITFKNISSLGAAKSISSNAVDVVLHGGSSDDISNLKSNVSSYFIPDNSYEYVVVNPSFYLDIRTRKAIISLLDIDSVNSSNDVTDITYSIPTFYGFEDNSEKSSYDPSLTVAWDLFTMSGYTVNEDGIMKDPKTGEQASFTFSLMPSEEGSAVHEMFENACRLLKQIGASAEVVFDPELIYNIYSEKGVAIYSLSWTVNGPDASLKERYSISSDTDTLKANGIQSLYIGGQIDNYGTVEYDNTSLNQSDAVDMLDSLIITSEKASEVSERHEMRSKALKLIRNLCFEIPVAQNGSYALVRTDRIDVSTLNDEPTVFSSLLSDIWNVKLISYETQNSNESQITENNTSTDTKQ